MPVSRSICFGIPQRWVIVLACFLGLFNDTNLQICLSVAITKMILSKNHTDSIKHESFSDGLTFDWDENTQGAIFSSFWGGYLVTCILSGKILEKLGGKYTMNLSSLSTSLCTLLIPIMIKWYGSTGLIVLRVFTGLGGGMLAPAVMRLLSRWIPEDERSSATAWAYAGGTFGLIIGTSASGAIIQRSQTGWPVMFYTYGLFGILVLCVQIVICYESPNEHPYISKSEMKFLREKLKHSHTDLPPTPWYHIIRSLPIWALLIALIGSCWCYLTLTSDTPKFMSSVLKFNVETNGYVSSLPYIGSWIVVCILSWISDRLINKKMISTAGIRKICHSIAMLGSGTFLVIVTNVGRDPTLVVGLYVFATILFSFHHVGALANILDLAPNYAGPIYGVLQGISVSIGFLSPHTVGWLAPNQTIDEWRIIFWLIFVIASVTNAVFVIFGKAEVQEWNDPYYLVQEKEGQDGDVKEKIELVCK